MKKHRLALSIVLATVILTSTVIPNNIIYNNLQVVEAATKKPKLNVKNNKKTLHVGDKFIIKVTNLKGKFEWVSLNNKIATVSKNGVVKAKSVGTTTIYATKGKYLIFCKINVKKSTKKKNATNKSDKLIPTNEPSTDNTIVDSSPVNNSSTDTTVNTIPDTTNSNSSNNNNENNGDDNKNGSSNSNNNSDSSVNNTTKFNADEAESKITITPIPTCKNLYEVTSTYDIPTRITAEYKIIDKSGAITSKASSYTLALPWDKSYISIPSDFDENTVQVKYVYSEAPSYMNISKEKYEKIKNGLQIVKFENSSKRPVSKIYDNEGNISYRTELIDVYIKNISNETLCPRGIMLLLYNNKGQIFELVKVIPNMPTSIEADETAKLEIEVIQLFSDQDISDIKFVIGESSFY